MQGKTNVTPEETLLSISAASDFLGVSEPALRQWTDAHKIKAFVTPGGHRRYSTAELRKFMRSNRTLFRIQDLASQMEGSALEHRKLDKSFLKTVSRYKIDSEAQAQFAALGREILTLIIYSISEPSHREETLKYIRENGAKFGEMTARMNMSLSDSIQVFIQHREPLMRITTDMMKKGEGIQRRVVDAIPLVDQVLDIALIELVQAHVQFKNVTMEIEQPKN